MSELAPTKYPWADHPLYRGMSHEAASASWAGRGRHLLPENGGDGELPPDDDWEAPSVIPPEADLLPEMSLTSVSMRLTSPANWRGTAVEPMQWLVENRIPAGDVTILSSDGGGGKTTIALQLAIAVAADLGDWLGAVAGTGPVIFVSAEEDEQEIRRRVERICRGRAVDPFSLTQLHLNFPDLEQSLFASVTKFGMSWTGFYDAFAVTVKQMRPALVVVDAVAAVFGGDHRDRAQVRQFMSTVRKLANLTGAAILLLDHPSLSGMSDGSGRSGSVDWNNTVRSRLYMRSDRDDQGLRELEVMKSNRGPKGETALLRWIDGAFTVEGSVQPLERAAAEAKVNDLFLRLLDQRNAEGRQVGWKPGRNYAPSVFENLKEAGGVKTKAFARSMDRLIASKAIVIKTYGPPSKQRELLERPS